MDLESLQKKATCTLETLRTSYLVTEGHILEDQNPQFHYYECLKTNS